MFVSIKYFRNKVFHFLKIVSIILLLHLLPACDISEEDYNQVLIDSTTVYLVNVENNSITKIIDGENPMFIPYTNKILYRSIDKIYTLDMISKDTKYIADMPGATVRLYTRLSLSKNGQYVSYTARGSNHTFDLFVASLITGGNNNLTRSTNSYESEGIFFSNDSKLLFYESINNPSGYFDSSGTSTIGLFGDNYSFLTRNKYPIGFSLNDRYCILKYDWDSSSSRGTIIYTYDMDLNRIIDSLLLDQQRIFVGPSLSDEMKLYYSSNKNNFYKLDLLTKQIDLLWTGKTSTDYKFSPDFKKVLVNHLNYVELINLETSQTKTYFSNESYKVFFGEPCFSEDSKSFLITRYYHDEYFN